MSVLSVKIILPSKVAFVAKADMVNIPGKEGVFGVLPDHSKLISNVNIGVITLFSRDLKKKYFVYGGVVQVTGFELNIISEFVADLGNTIKSNVLDNITNLKSDLSDEKEGTIEAESIADKIEKYQALLTFL